MYGITFSTFILRKANLKSFHANGRNFGKGATGVRLLPVKRIEEKMLFMAITFATLLSLSFAISSTIFSFNLFPFFNNFTPIIKINLPRIKNKKVEKYNFICLFETCISSEKSA